MLTHIPDILALSDTFWGFCALRRDPLFGKLPQDQIPEYIRRSTTCGIQEAQILKYRSGRLPIKEQFSRSGIKLIHDSAENGGHQIIFAQFVEPDEVTLSLDAQKRMAELGVWELISPDASFEEILLSHEFFHFIESQKNSSIYTQTEKIQLWRKPFSNRSSITALSEIAAMAFAKEYLQLTFCPFALDILMLYLYDEKGAENLYERIMEEWEVWKTQS